MANETSRGRTVFRVPSPKDPLATMHAPGGYQAHALQWKVSPLVLSMGSAAQEEYGWANDAVELSVGTYTFTYSGGISGAVAGGRQSSCEFTVQIEGNECLLFGINYYTYSWWVDGRG